MDKSPLERSLLARLNFATTVKDGIRLCESLYSRPTKSGREFLENGCYDKVWRLGPMRQWEFKAYQDMTAWLAKKIKSRNLILCLRFLEKGEWTIILNSRPRDYWEQYSIYWEEWWFRFTVPTNQLPEVVKAFSIRFWGSGKINTAVICGIAWDPDNGGNSRWNIKI